MDNNEIYVNEVIEAYLNSKEEMKTLDEVTVKSLFRTCIETINPELPHSSVIIRGIRNPDKTYSVKLKNIKLNFNFAEPFFRRPVWNWKKMMHTLYM